METDSDDRRNWPRYTATETSRLTGTTAQHLRVWFRGMTRGGVQTSPLFTQRARDPGRPLDLTFLELVETYVVARYREHGASVARLRSAHEFARRALGAEHPFATQQFAQTGADLFHTFSKKHPAERVDDELVRVDDTPGRWVLAHDLAKGLDLFDYDEDGVCPLAHRFHPFGRNIPIVIFPARGSGSLTIEDMNVLAEVIGSRYRGSDPIDVIAEEYQMEEDEVWKVLQTLGAA